MPTTVSSSLVTVASISGSTYTNITLSQALNHIWQQKIGRINNVVPNATGTVILNLSDLADVDRTTVSGPTNGQLLSFNSTLGKWSASSLTIPQTISITSGTLALRPASPTVTSVYIVENDTPNNGRTFIWNIASGVPSWIEVLPKYKLSDLVDAPLVSGALGGDVIIFDGTQWVPIPSGSLSSSNIYFDDLFDVVSSGAVSGDTIVFNGTNWIPTPSGSGVSSLSLLSDVSVSGVTAGNVLAFDGTSWIPSGVVSSTSVSYLDDLLDVTVTGAIAGNTLVFDGTSWLASGTSGVTSLGALTDTSGVNSANVGNVLVFDGNYWVPSSSGTVNVSLSLEDLSNVSGVAGVGDVLFFDGSNWVPVASGSYTPPSISFLDELSDVVVSGALTNDLLMFDGSNWVPVPSGSVSGNYVLKTGDIISGDLGFSNSSTIISGVINSSGIEFIDETDALFYYKKTSKANEIFLDKNDFAVPMHDTVSLKPTGIVLDELIFGTSHIDIGETTKGMISLTTNGIASIPTIDEHVVTKKYVDDSLANQTLASHVDVSSGTINPGDTLVFDGSLWIPIPSGTGGPDTSQYTGEPTGFPVDATGAIDHASSLISFDDGTRTFTIAPASTSFDIIIKGVRYSKLGSSITIPNVTGNYYIYFDESGVIQYTNTFSLEIIYKYVYLANVYWSATQSKAIIFGDERHGCTMDSHTHAHLHTSMGAVYISGCGLNTFSVDGNGSLDSHAQFGVDSGSIRDEDILHSLTGTVSTGSVPTLYRIGSEWQSDLGVFNFKNGGSGRVQYNSGGSGAYALTEVANNNFTLTHVVATNDPLQPFIALMGLNEYSNIPQAREGAMNEIGQYTDLPFMEFVFIGTVILKTSNTFSNSAKAIVVSTDLGGNYVDWRFSESINPMAALQEAASRSYVDSKFAGDTSGGSSDYLKAPQLNSSGVLDTSFIDLKLEDLSDVTAGAIAGNAIVFDGNSWVPGPSGSTALSELSDVYISGTPSNGNQLIFNGGTNRWEPGTQIIGGGGGSYLSTLLDVSVSGITSDDFLKYDGSVWRNTTIKLDDLSDTVVSGTPSIDESLVFNGSFWVPKSIIAGPVVSSSDANKAPILNSSGQLDITTLPLGAVKSVNGNNPDVLGNVTLGLTTVLTGTLATRPASSTNGDIYIVSGDTASNNGRTFVYRSSDTTWYEINPLGGSGVAKFKVVSSGGSDITGVGTFNSPYATIQYAISQVGNVGAVYVLPGSYTENLTINNVLNLLIEGVGSPNGSYPVSLNGNVTISGTSTRIRLKDLQINATSTNPVPLLDTGSDGRHFFQNVEFIPFTTSNAVTYSGSTKNFHIFIDCVFSGTGTVNLGTTPAVGASAFFQRPGTLYNLVIPGNYSGGVSINDTDYLGINHSASPLGLTNIRSITSFTSTATNLNGLLFIYDCSTYVAATNSWTPLNKSGNAPFRFKNLEIAKTGNTINGSELNTAAKTLYQKIDSLLDVDTSTTPPTNGQALVWNGGSSKWVPATVAGGGGGTTLIYQSATPGFFGLTIGTIWVKSDTMEQFIYIQDDLAQDVWVALGTTATISQTSASDQIPFGTGPQVFENILTQQQDVTVGIPTVDYKYRMIGAPNGFTFTRPSQYGKNFINIGYMSTPGSGLAIKVPAGIKAVWLQFPYFNTTANEAIINCYWNGTSANNLVNILYIRNDTGTLNFGTGALYPTGFYGQKIHPQFFAWRMISLPDSLGGILYLNNSYGINNNGADISGIGFSENTYNVTQTSATDLFGNYLQQTIPTLPAHTPLAFTGMFMGDTSVQLLDNTSPRRSIPYIDSGNDKMIVICVGSPQWEVVLPYNGIAINGIKVPFKNIRFVNDWFTDAMNNKRGLMNQKLICLRVPAGRMSSNPIGGVYAQRFAEITFDNSGTGTNGSTPYIQWVYTYDISYDIRNQY